MNEVNSYNSVVLINYARFTRKYLTSTFLFNKLTALNITS